MKTRVTPESVEACLAGLPATVRTQVSRVRRAIRKAAGDPAVNAAVAPYRSGKATLKFPLDQPVPLELVNAAVKFRKLAMLAAARKKAQ